MFTLPNALHGYPCTTQYLINVFRLQPSISRILKRQQSKQSLSGSLPDIKKERIGASHSGRLVFYPKPLPYPKNLPLTRTVGYLDLIDKFSGVENNYCYHNFKYYGLEIVSTHLNDIF